MGSCNNRAPGSFRKIFSRRIRPRGGFGWRPGVYWDHTEVLRPKRAPGEPGVGPARGPNGPITPFLTWGSPGRFLSALGLLEAAAGVDSSRSAARGPVGRAVGSRGRAGRPGETRSGPDLDLVTRSGGRAFLCGPCGWVARGRPGWEAGMGASPAEANQTSQYKHGVDLTPGVGLRPRGDAYLF